jgi:hypothetical protein
MPGMGKIVRLPNVKAATTAKTTNACYTTILLAWSRALSCAEVEQIEQHIIKVLGLYLVL